MDLKAKVILTYILFSVAFFISMAWSPYPASFLVKAIPAFSMGIYFLMKEEGLANKLFGVGFIFSSFGDIFLDLDRVNYFVFGLASFLIAHILYTICFIKKADSSSKNYFLMAIVVLILTVVTYLIFPNLGKLTIPVSLYILAIGGMGISASFHPEKTRKVFIGAVIFMLSDSMIAIDKFLTKIPYVGFFIISTYYLGHFLMAIGNMDQEAKK